MIWFSAKFRRMMLIIFLVELLIVGLIKLFAPQWLEGPPPRQQATATSYAKAPQASPVTTAHLPN